MKYSDSDLYTLHREEARLFREYVHANTEEARYPARIAEKRDAWITLHRKLRAALPADELRRILRSDIPENALKAREAAKEAARKEARFDPRIPTRRRFT